LGPKSGKLRKSLKISSQEPAIEMLQFSQCRIIMVCKYRFVQTQGSKVEHEKNHFDTQIQACTKTAWSVVSEPLGSKVLHWLHYTEF